MYINSPGGVVSQGMGIYDTMQYISPPVATWCLGQACSMGAFLLAAGAPGMRKSLPNATIMIHQPSGGAGVSGMIKYAQYLFRHDMQFVRNSCKHI